MRFLLKQKVHKPLHTGVIYVHRWVLGKNQKKQKSKGQIQIPTTILFSEVFGVI